MKILLLGTCQVFSFESILKTINLGELTSLRYNDVTATNLESDWFSQFDLVVTHSETKNRSELWAALQHHPRIVFVPVLFFRGFTPDDEISISMQPGNGPVMLSRIAVGAHRNNLSKDEAVSLYCPEFCDLMGYPAVLDDARRNLVARLSPFARNINQLYSKWYAKSPFFFTPNHPKLFVVEDVLREALLGQAGINIPENLSEICDDPLEAFIVSPLMNHPIARNLITNPTHLRRQGSTTRTCEQFLAHCYNLLTRNRETVSQNTAANRIFDNALEKWRERKASALSSPVSNPYKEQPGRAFWARAVARPASTDVTPIGQTSPIISKRTKVATAGSCFAQHVARAMVADGLNYYVAEPAPANVDRETAEKHGYGLFSARYGNIYSSRQLLQLFLRAFGEFEPQEVAWAVKDGYVDPFRPNIGETFETTDALVSARNAHLAKVREMFETLDVFVFTMGLTEGWIDLRDGAAFPVAPAAVSSNINPDIFDFKNSDYVNVHAEMIEFLVKLGRVNPSAQVILTVSPVPLIATYTNSDALSATTYSKAVLRAVASDLANGFDNVSYFPSYEIITGAHARGGYFSDDLRSVRPEGVDHVMRVFRDLLVFEHDSRPRLVKGHDHSQPDAEYLRESNIVCDEEMLVR